MTIALLPFLLAAQIAAAVPPKPAPPSKPPVPVEVVVYSDFQCPFCAQFSGPFRDLQKKGVAGAMVTVEFKNFPLSAIHPAAPLAHQAALAGKAQGKFWEMHDLLFANQARAQRSDLIGYAKSLGLDMVRFERDMDSDAVKQVIAADLAEGRKLDIAGTPTFFINGQQFGGTRTSDQLKALVAAEVKSPHKPVTAAAKESAQSIAVISTEVPTAFDLVLYSDFQCPFCEQLAPSIRDLQRNGAAGTKITVQFKNFPLSIHPNSQLAHQAAMAAKAQGKFWEMHDVLFANQQRVQRADLVEYAKKLGLDVAKFEKDMDGDSVKQAISADLEEGTKAGVNGTPSFSINGKMYSGTRSLAQMKELLGGEQRRARALAEIPDTGLSRGSASAPIVLELFADLESPVTKPTVAIVNQLLQQYPDRVKVQFRNFPLSFHPQAALAHEAAMAASRDGRFWEFVAYILDHQDSLREQELIAYAGRVGLDQERFAKALAEHRYAPRVEADIAAGQGRGIHGSPAIVINGKRIDGVPSLQTLAQYVAGAAEGSKVAATPR